MSPIPTPTEPIATAATRTTSSRIAPPPSTTAARVSDGPMTIGRVVAGAVAAARIGLVEEVRVDCPGQRLEAVDDPRARVA